MGVAVSIIGRPGFANVVQEVRTGILARGLPPDLRASEYCEWTPFFSLIISESYFKIFAKYFIQHVILLEVVLIIVIFIEIYCIDALVTG